MTPLPTFPTVYQHVFVHWRVIILLLVLALAAFLIVYADFFDLFLFALFLLFIASQIFWIGRILDLGERFIPCKSRRAWLTIIAGLVYAFLFTYSYPEWSVGHVFHAADYRPQSMIADHSRTIAGTAAHRRNPNYDMYDLPVV